MNGGMDSPGLRQFHHHSRSEARVSTSEGGIFGAVETYGRCKKFLETERRNDSLPKRAKAVSLSSDSRLPPWLPAFSW